MPTFQPSILPAGAYRVSNKNHDYWIVDADGNIIGQTGANGQDTFFASYQTDSNGNVVGLLGPRGEGIVLGSIKNTAVALGDSIIANGLITTGTTAIYTARNIPQLASALLKQRLNVIADKGVSGNTLADMLARFDADVTPYYPGWVILEGTSNDINADLTSASILASLDAIYAKCALIGANLVFVNTTGGGFGTALRHTTWFEVCVGSMQRAATLDNFFYAPMYPGAIDCATTANADGCVAKSGYLYASPHPSATGVHLAYGPAVARFFDNILPTPNHQIGSRSPGGTDYDKSTLVMSGAFAGTTGTPGTGNSGTLPTRWVGSRTGSIAAVFSVADRTDGGFGRYMIADLSASAAAADAVSITLPGTSSDSCVVGLAGRTVRFECDYVATATSGTIGQLEMQIAIKDGSGSLLFTAAANQIVGTEYLGITSESGRFRTPEFVLPANCDRVVPLFILGTSSGGAANIKLAGLDGYVVS